MHCGVNKLCSDCYQDIAVLFSGFIYAVVAVFEVLPSSVQIIPKLLSGKQVLEIISWYSIKYSILYKYVYIHYYSKVWVC